MSRRSDALAEESRRKFIDPISLDLMKDPVTAADGLCYDRATITAWFNILRSKGEPITSPLTNSRLPNETLTPNTALKRELDTFLVAKSTIQAADIKFTLSSEIFKDLDRISSLPEMELLELPPPKIIVLGNESHGKSTILERIIGLPLFPKEKGICTRCIIRVHLRRCPADQPSIAEISVVPTASSPQVRQVRGHQSPPAGRTVSAALDNIRDKIKEVMEDLVRMDPQRRMIIDDCEIVVKINLPYCLNVDILDLPGLVTTSPPSTTQNLPQVTKNLAMKVIQENKESSIFLLINDIKVPPNQSRGCEVVQEGNIEKQTLGIFTKVDTFVSEDGTELAELQNLLNNVRTTFPVGYGWMAAASRVSEAAACTDKLRALQIIESSEKRLIDEKYSTLDQTKLGIQNIRQKIQSLYEIFIADHWIPTILQKITKFTEVFQKDMAKLGSPLPSCQEYKPMVDLFAKNRISLGTIDEAYIRKFVSTVFTDFLEKAEKQLIQLGNDHEFWQLLSDYQAFIDSNKQTDRNGYHSYDQYGENSGGDIPYKHVGSRNHHYSTNHGSSVKAVYQFGRNGSVYEREGPAIEIEKHRSALEGKLRQVINELYRRLHNRINPDLNFITQITRLIDENNLPQYAEFHLRRFPVLRTALIRVIEHGFNKVVQAFDTWFGEMIKDVYASPLLLSEYSTQNGTVWCKLYWSNPTKLQEYPHKMLDKFYECLRENISEKLVSDLTSRDMDTSNESCKSERIQLFTRMRKVIEVKNSVIHFQTKVSPPKYQIGAWAADKVSKSPRPAAPQGSVEGVEGKPSPNRSSTRPPSILETLRVRNRNEKF